METEFDANELDEALNRLIEVAVEDYKRWSDGISPGFVEKNPDTISFFAERFGFEHGKKYIKVTHGVSTWAFINLRNPDFKYGDILKMKSTGGPKLDAARGNIFKPGYRVRWTGPVKTLASMNLTRY